MGLKFWWFLFIWAIVIGLYWIVRYMLRKRRHVTREKHKIPVAHSDRLTDLPEYKTALKRYELLVKVVSVSLSVAMLSAMIISARPTAVTYITPAQKGRDIMLCLDVSGSLLRVDATIVNRFSSLVNNFSGQRIGLTVFNSSSISVIPLSDDYTFINEQLTDVGKALADQKGDAFDQLTSGTLADFDRGTSLVSDGVTSCINNLGANPLKRSQSVILATDNEANGTPIISNTQAAALAKKKNVRIYAIDPGTDDTARAADHEALKKLAEETAGSYHTLNSKDTVSSIIEGVSRQEAKYAASTPVVAVADKPSVLVYFLMFSTVVSIVIIWRLRL